MLVPRFVKIWWLKFKIRRLKARLQRSLLTSSDTTFFGDPNWVADKFSELDPEVRKLREKLSQLQA